MFQTYSVKDRESCNVSSHVPVQVRLKIDSVKIQEGKCNPIKKSNQTKQTLLWNKIDLDKYLPEIQSNLPTIMSKVSHPESAVNSVTECLIAAGQTAVPVKTVKLKGPKQRVSSEVMGCLKKVKVTYREWAAVGKPRSGHLFVENKMAERTFGLINEGRDILEGNPCMML